MTERSDLVVEIFRAALLNPSESSRCTLSEAGLLCEDCPLGLGDKCLMTCMLDPVIEAHNTITPANIIMEIVKTGNHPKPGEQNLFIKYPKMLSAEEKNKYKNTIKGIYRRLPFKYKSNPNRLPINKKGELVNRFADIDLV